MLSMFEFASIDLKRPSAFDDASFKDALNISKGKKSIRNSPEVDLPIQIRKVKNTIDNLKKVTD